VSPIAGAILEQHEVVKLEPVCSYSRTCVQEWVDDIFLKDLSQATSSDDVVSKRVGRMN
jgi:hypothetical protein